MQNIKIKELERNLEKSPVDAFVYLFNKEGFTETIDEFFKGKNLEVYKKDEENNYFLEIINLFLEKSGMTLKENKVVLL